MCSSIISLAHSLGYSFLTCPYTLPILFILSFSFSFFCIFPHTLTFFPMLHVPFICALALLKISKVPGPPVYPLLTCHILLCKNYTSTIHSSLRHFFHFLPCVLSLRVPFPYFPSAPHSLVWVPLLFLLCPFLSCGMCQTLSVLHVTN